MSSWYLDTSALLKLIVLEKESSALQLVVGDSDLTSTFTRLEVARALKPYSELAKDHAGKILNSVLLIPIDSEIMAQAELVIRATELKAPDAIHVATAMKLGTLVEGIITYDMQMAAVASRLGMKVASPA